MKALSYLIPLALAIGHLHATVNSPRQAQEDWSVNIVKSTIQRHKPSSIGGWDYYVSLYLMGQYVVYKRTQNETYLTYIQQWADRFFDASANLNVTIDSLDSMQPGNIMLILYHETGDEKYARAAKAVRDSLDTYPRLTDGAFWHAKKLNQQIWADGSFMVNPFLARYGEIFGEQSYTEEETTDQLIAYGDHLQVSNGLLQHVYDESRASKWVDPVTGLSAEQWCRAMGWYGMAMTDILDLIPKTHPNRSKILQKLQKFIQGVQKYQDAATGRWWQIVNKGNLTDNWTETSCSAMFTYTTNIALARGWLRDSHNKFENVVKTGHAGVLEQVRKNETTGLTDVVEIVIGTGLGDLAFYLARPRKTNDLHGLGAVLLMNEQVLYGGRVDLGV